MTQMKFKIESRQQWFGKKGGKICRLPALIETPESVMLEMVNLLVTTWKGEHYILFFPFLIYVMYVRKIWQSKLLHLGPVVRSLVSANRWLRAIKTCKFPWYLTLVSTNHASSNPGLYCMVNPHILFWNGICDVNTSQKGNLSTALQKD